MITVEVTQEDIAGSKPGDARDCAIACALKRMGYARPLVNDLRIYVGNTFCDTPDAARVFLYRFDRRAQVKPISFPLDLPAPEELP